MAASRIDMSNYPEIRRALAERDRQVNMVRAWRKLEHHQADAILVFWRELAARIEEEDEMENIEVILREIGGDIDMLKGLKFSLEVQKEIDPASAAQILQVVRLIQLLLDIMETFKKRHWVLRERALVFWLSLNPAIPSKAREKKDQEKDDKKKGQAKVKSAMDETKKPEADTKQKQPDKEQVRQKKMQA